MFELINTMTANFGGTITVAVIAFLIVLTIFTLLVPFYVWNIHNQTSRITKELIKLNHSIKGLSLRQPYLDRKVDEIKVDEIAKPVFKENQIEPFTERRLSGQAIRPKKVFYKPDDELPVHKRKTS